MKNTLLRGARLRKGWSQQQLADFAAIGRSTVERAERGKPIRVDNIQWVCACLEKTPEQLGLVKLEYQQEGSAPQDQTKTCSGDGEVKRFQLVG